MSEVACRPGGAPAPVPLRLLSGDDQPTPRYWELEGLDWVRTVDPHSTGKPLSAFRFFGIVGTWMEEDVITASVANAFEQGCEEVYLVDNESPDDTVERGVAAGATFALSYHTEHYDETLRLALMNEVARRVTVDSGADHVWWLWFDADEFAHGPGGQSLRRHLESLDGRCRVVGCRYFNHFPSGRPHYVSPHHPLRFQPLCYELSIKSCRQMHRKHPLVRFDRAGPPVVVHEGFHRAWCPDGPLVEAPWAAFVHHFPYRARHVTERRLRVLCGPGVGEESRIAHQDRCERERFGVPSSTSRRYAIVDAVYRGDWSAVPNEQPGCEDQGVTLADWRSLFRDEDRMNQGGSERWRSPLPGSAGHTGTPTPLFRYP